MAQREDDPLVGEEEAKAAEEAARIGGTAPETGDPAERAVREAGGGEAEGFEQAEEALIEHAEHTAGEGAPRPDQMGEEAEPDPGQYGDPDRLEPEH
jgi:hypothetical protein